jgi:hypothetical protein
MGGQGPFRPGNIGQQVTGFQGQQPAFMGGHAQAMQGRDFRSPMPGGMPSNSPMVPPGVMPSNGPMQTHNSGNYPARPMMPSNGPMAPPSGPFLPQNLGRSVNGMAQQPIDYQSIGGRQRNAARHAQAGMPMGWAARTGY